MTTNASELEIILAHGPELTAGGLDYYKLGQWCAGLPDSRILALNPALPPAELEARLRAFLHHGEDHPVLVAALNPQHRARDIIGVLLEQLHLNPELLTVLDLQEALGYQDPRACNLKAHHLIRLAASMITRALPITVQEVPVSLQVLVWGDSFAALKAAVDLAELGYSILHVFPGPALQPLVPGAAAVGTPQGELGNLLHQAQSHPNMKPVPAARLLQIQGSAGNFRVRLESPQGLREEPVGALVLAPELRLEPGTLPALPEAPSRLVSQTRLEELLASPEEAAALLHQGAAGCKVAFLGGDNHPLALGRVLQAATPLLSRENCQVLLFVRDAKVAAPEMEAALQAAQASGLIVYKLQELPALSLEDGSPCLTFFDPVMHWEEKVACDLVVQEEVYRAAPESAPLAELFRLHPGPAGFLQGDNVRNLPVATNRRGIYVAGPGRGIMDLDQALAEADAAVTEIQHLLGSGLAPAPRGRAVVDRGRCVLCLTCHRLCPHGAVTWDNRAIINELACQGCGVCASQCPNEAIQICNFTDDQVLAAMSTLDPRLTPKIIAFLCKNSAWEAYHAAVQLEHASLPLGFTPLRMPCAGKIDIDYLLRAFTYGADAVLVLACHPDNCKSQQGNEHARWRVERAQSMLAEAGVDPRRLVFKSLAANAPQDFLAAVQQVSELLELLKTA
jgi:coenzyme F420-reducing hydrogenase delta subunit/NAD-dependent dihydropyrimidine dehydrogenase PreA subunit